MMNSTPRRPRQPDTRPSEKRIWSEIRNRCLNPCSFSYPYYGGRGITICEAWAKSYEQFIRDMGPRPSPQHTVDRIDNEGHYCAENCRWATRIEQANNMRKNHILEFEGRTLTIAEWARALGIQRGTLTNRIARGWSAERALSTPLRQPASPQLVEYEGETLPVFEWARRLGVSRQALARRLDMGWSVEEAFRTPISPEYSARKTGKTKQG